VSSSRSCYEQTRPLTVRDLLPIPVSSCLNKGGILLRGSAHAAANPPRSTRLPHPTERTPISCSLDRSSHSPRVLPKKRKTHVPLPSLRIMTLHCLFSALSAAFPSRSIPMARLSASRFLLTPSSTLACQHMLRRSGPFPSASCFHLAASLL
jgi:hypothetical protein